MIRKLNVGVTVAAALAVACSSANPTPSSDAPPEPPLGSAPVDSDLAASFNGGGCYPTGIQSGDLDQIVLINPHWVPVIDGQQPDSVPIQVHGIAHGSHGDTGGDFPSDHLRSDATLSIELDPSLRGRLATGNVDDEGGTMELEWDSGVWPAWAWPGEGDGIVALGRWIFDCGHDAAKPGKCSTTTSQACILATDCQSETCSTCVDGETCVGAHFGYQAEIHPPHATAAIRGGRGAVVSSNAAATAVLATRVDIFVSPDGGPAGDRCAMTHGTFGQFISSECYPLSQPMAPINARDFAFDVPLPPRPTGAQATWRVEARETPGGVPAVLDVTAHDDPEPHLSVSVRMTKETAQGMPTGYAATLYAGWSAPSTPLTHVRVTIDGVVVSNALKPAKPVIRDAPGWVMQAGVDGEWQMLAGLDNVHTGDAIPQTLVFDEYLPPDGVVDLTATGTSRACIDTMFGKSLKQSIQEITLTNLEACLRDSPANPGMLHATYRGPDFGAGTGSMSYETASTGADGGFCSKTNTACVTEKDCPSGETCAPHDGAFTLRYHVERLAQ